MVCAVEKIEKSILFLGKGAEMFPKRRTSNVTAKCLNTFVAYCRLFCLLPINCIYRGFIARFLADELCGTFQIPHLVVIG